jgi:Matrixin
MPRWRTGRRKGWRVESWLGAALACTVPHVADAYCRTTTVPIPAGYDPTTSGCISEGVPLAWPTMPVTYQLEQQASKQVSLEAATPIFEMSFAKWGAVTCFDASGSDDTPAVSFQDLGSTDAGYASCEAGPCGYSANTAPHVIIFRDDGWPYNDPSNTLALTTVTFGEDTGHIYAADMEINTFEHQIATGTPLPSGTYSLEAIATHEAGHFIGMAHSQIDTAVMYAHYQPDAVSLTMDDIEGVCAIYPPQSPKAGGSGCAAGGGLGRSSTRAGVPAEETGRAWVLLPGLALVFVAVRRVARRRPS